MHFLKWLLILSCLGMVMTCAVTAKGIFPYEYTVKTLANGLTIIAIPMENPGLVAYYSVVRTGSRDEWEPGHSGFAHFFEHMMFRGTEKYPGPVYDRLITEMGASANAYTTDDYTCYHMVFSKGNLEKVIDLESDRFQNLSYAEADFKTEAGAVKGEYLKGLASPWFLLNEKVMDTAFDRHTYKHTTIGFFKDVEAMPTMYEYSKSFFQRYYRPENVVILVTGDLETEPTFALMEKYYGNWQPGYVAPQITPEPPQTGERTAQVSYDGRTLPILNIAYKGPAFTVSNKDMAACYVLGNLAFGETSAIYKKLVLQEQKVQFISADFGFHRDPNLLEIATMINAESDIEAVRAEIYATIANFQTTPVTPEKLAAEKSNMKYGFLMRLDTAERVAAGLARFVALSRGIEVVDQFFQLMDELTPEDIQKAAQTFLIPQGRTVVILKGGQK